MTLFPFYVRTNAARAFIKVRLTAASGHMVAWRQLCPSKTDRYGGSKETVAPILSRLDHVAAFSLSSEKPFLV